MPALLSASSSASSACTSGWSSSLSSLRLPRSINSRASSPPSEALPGSASSKAERMNPATARARSRSISERDRAACAASRSVRSAAACHSVTASAIRTLHAVSAAKATPTRVAAHEFSQPGTAGGFRKWKSGGPTAKRADRARDHQLPHSAPRRPCAGNGRRSHPVRPAARVPRSAMLRGSAAAAGDSRSRASASLMRGGTVSRIARCGSIGSRCGHANGSAPHSS